MHKYINVPYISEEMWGRHDKFLRRLEVVIGELHETKVIDFNKFPNFEINEDSEKCVQELRLVGGNRDRGITWSMYLTFEEDPQYIEEDIIYLIYYDRVKSIFYNEYFGLGKNLQDTILSAVREFLKRIYSNTLV